MAMHEVYLDEDQHSVWSKNTFEENEARLTNDWKNERAVVREEITPIATLKERIANFDEVRKDSMPNEMFIVATFHQAVIEKILGQPGGTGLRLYLSFNKDTGSFEPIIVAVDDKFEDIINDDRNSNIDLFCTTASKCPPPEPTSNCPKNLLLLPESLLSAI